jgi:hypothetical protein
MSSLFKLNITLGAFEVGVLISVFLFGIVTCQSYVYYRKFPLDAWILRLLVAIIWILELGHTLSITHSLYTITVTDFGNPIRLLKPPYSLNLSILCSAFIGPLVQAWFAYRVLKFSERLYIPVFCWFLSFLRCVATIVAAIEAFPAPNIITFETQWQWLLTFILTVGAAVDIIIAVSFCYFIKQHRSTSFGRTVKTINQLMIWTVETGLVTSVGAVAMLICFLIMPENYIWLAIFTFLAKLFSNSLLAALNARSVNRDKEPDPVSSTFFDKMPSSGSVWEPIKQSRYPGIAIEMARTTEVVRDDESFDKWDVPHAV